VSSRRMELAGLHRDIVAAGPLIQTRDAELAVDMCAVLPAIIAIVPVDRSELSRRTAS
jgi:hypothetical protein